VNDLAEASFALKTKLGYSDTDARTVVLDNIGSVARGGQMILNLLDSWSRGDELIRQCIPQLIGLTTVTPWAAQRAGDVLEKTNRLALATLAQFQIENAFRNVGRELGLPDPGVGFYACAREVLTALGIPSDRMQMLNVPARIRNSLHRNGIHHRQHPNETTRVVVRGVTYEFLDGQPVSCAGWEHIAHALEASVGVIEEVFLSPQVIAISDPMMDQYAWEQATKP
jgi:hypothetical protein